MNPPLEKLLTELEAMKVRLKEVEAGAYQDMEGADALEFETAETLYAAYGLAALRLVWGIAKIRALHAPDKSGVMDSPL